MGKQIIGLSPEQKQEVARLKSHGCSDVIVSKSGSVLAPFGCTLKFADDCDERSVRGVSVDDVLQKALRSVGATALAASRSHRATLKM